MLEMNSIYNDKFYLSNPTTKQARDVLLEADYRKVELMENQIAELKKYGKVIEAYDDFIAKCAKLIIELKLPNDELHISIAILRLMFRDALSYKKLHPTRRVTKELHSAQGASIIYGQYCCRNVTDLHQRIFKKLDIDRSRVYCNSFEDHTIRPTSDSDHIVNLIKHDGIYYIFDPANLCLLEFTDSLDIRGINYPEDNYHIKPGDFYMLEDRPIEEIKKLVEGFRLASMSHHITLEEYMQIEDEAIELVDQNKPLIKDFEEDTKEEKRFIAKNIPSILKLTI